MTRHPVLGLGIVDTMIGFPTDPDQIYGALRASYRDKESREEFTMPAQYMFADVPSHEVSTAEASVALTIAEMDRCGVEVGLISASLDPERAEMAVRAHPGRFVTAWSCDPNEGMEGVRRLVAAHERFDLRAAAFMPHGYLPQVAVDAPTMYPYYAKCVELGIPVFVTVGIAGPRVPSLVQHVERIDQVMYDFPELVFVMRHGAEPWVDLAVKLMLKWPNLYYSTSAFAPKFYPQEVIDYANTRGSEKVLYAGYFPMGLSLERIMSEMPAVPFKDEVWPKFLRANAARILGLDR